MAQKNERKEDMYISSEGEHFCLHVKAIYTVSFPFLFDFRWVFRFLSKGSVRINQKVQQTAALKILTHSVFDTYTRACGCVRARTQYSFSRWIIYSFGEWNVIE